LDPDDRSGRLAEVAFLARGHEVVGGGGPASDEGHDVVDMEDDAGCSTRPPTVPAAKAIALQDVESKPGGDGVAGSRDAARDWRIRPHSESLRASPTARATRSLDG